MSLEQITKTYNSFSGCDMVVTCNIFGQSITLGTLQTITYSIHMDRHPIRSIGNINAKDYTLGPRTIAGSLVFAVFDKHLLYHMIEAFRDKSTNTIEANQYTNVATKYQSFTGSRHILADELPPFDITITFANEYGKRSRASIYGVRLVNEGQVMSINDIYTENTYQFVAVDLGYMNSSEEVVGTFDGNFVVDEDPQYDIKIDIGGLIDIDPVIRLSYEQNKDDSDITNLIIEKLDDMYSDKRLGSGTLHIIRNSDNKDISINVLNADAPHIEYIKLDPNYAYSAYFIEAETENRSQTITIHPRNNASLYYPPVIERVKHSADGYLFTFRCLSALLQGHSILRIENAATEMLITESILSENGTTSILCSLFSDGETYRAYTVNMYGTQSRPNVFTYHSDNLNLYTYLCGVIEHDYDICETFLDICDSNKLHDSESFVYSAYILRNSNFFGGYQEFCDYIDELSSYENSYYKLLNSKTLIQNDISKYDTYFILSPDINEEHYNTEKDYLFENHVTLPQFYFDDSIPYDSVGYIYYIDTQNNNVSLPTYVYKPTKEKIQEMVDERQALLNKV